MLEEALARSGRQLDVALESHQLVTVGRMVASGLGAARCRRCVKRRWHRWAPSASRSAIRRLRSASARIRAGHLPLSKAAQALLDTLKGFLPT